MKGDIVRSPYLTKDMAERAIDHVVLGLFGSPLGDLLNRKCCCVIVTTQTYIDTGGGEYVPTQGTPVPLTRKFFGRLQWEKPFDQYAASKMDQIWRNRANGHIDVVPHRLLPDDFPKVGGWMEQGVATACSGFQNYADMFAVSMPITALCIWMARHAYETSVNLDKRVPFTLE